jgi:hypothetical protein
LQERSEGREKHDDNFNGFWVPQVARPRVEQQTRVPGVAGLGARPAPLPEALEASVPDVQVPGPRIDAVLAQVAVTAKPEGLGSRGKVPCAY